MPTTSVFDKKIFNGEVFQGYVDRIPNPNRTELIRSRAIRPRPDLAAAMADQDGGNYLTTTLKGLINNHVPQNYDGTTNLVAGSTVTFKHSRVVVGRMAGWTENDFSYDITGGQDFIENIAQQISEYWEEIDQGTIVNILTGVFNMSDAAGAEFVDKHTTDVTGNAATSEVAAGCMSGTTLNSAIQKACGDNKGKFSLAIMHSQVATNLENLKLLAYMKYTDAKGIERDLQMATLNGRVVLIDDSMPTVEVVGTQGVYTLQITTAPAAGDKITIFGVEYTWVANGTTSTDTNLVLPSTVNASNCAQVLYNKLNALTTGTATKYTITRSTDTITFTQKTTAYGYHKPVVTVTQAATDGALVVAVAETTASAEYVQYTTFVLGDGAIEYTNCGAKVAYEVDRDPATNGGQDTLYSRQRKCFAPYGISFTMASMSTLSPSDSELRNGANWELVNSATAEGKQYISHKTIPIARIISKG